MQDYGFQEINGGYTVYVMQKYRVLSFFQGRKKKLRQDVSSNIQVYSLSLTIIKRKTRENQIAKQPNTVKLEWIEQLVCKWKLNKEVS